MLVEITDYGSKNKNPEGRIKQIIGHINDPGTDILSIVYAYELSMEFPDKVMNQAEKVSSDVSQADREGQLDLRTLPVVTIDGEDAKDLDDGISLTKEEDLSSGGSHCGCDQLCAGEQRPGPGGFKARNQRLPGGPGDSHAAPYPVQWNLFPKSRGGPSGTELSDGYK